MDRWKNSCICSLIFFFLPLSSTFWSPVKKKNYSISVSLPFKYFMTVIFPWLSFFRLKIRNVYINTFLPDSVLSHLRWVSMSIGPCICSQWLALLYLSFYPSSPQNLYPPLLLKPSCPLSGTHFQDHGFHFVLTQSFSISEVSRSCIPISYCTGLAF